MVECLAVATSCAPRVLDGIVRSRVHCTLDELAALGQSQSQLQLALDLTSLAPLVLGQLHLRGASLQSIGVGAQQTRVGGGHRQAFRG